MNKASILRFLCLAVVLSAAMGIRNPAQAQQAGEKEKRLLYVASPGIRNYLEHGGYGVLVYDIEGGHRNELLGFEVGDLTTGKMLHRVEVPGYKTGEVKRHGCPSHGIGLTPDEKELWLGDSFNGRLHIFDMASMPPKFITSIQTKDLPGWITFSIDGKYAYPSSGEVIDTHSRKVVAELKDENGKPVQSEKLLEIIFVNGRAVRAGDQFGIGRVVKQGGV